MDRGAKYTDDCPERLDGDKRWDARLPRWEARSPHPAPHGTAARVSGKTPAPG